MFFLILYYFRINFFKLVLYIYSNQIEEGRRITNNIAFKQNNSNIYVHRKTERDRDKDRETRSSARREILPLFQISTFQFRIYMYTFL